MLRRPVSIQDIAHAANVSHATVSRALRDSPLISAEVRERIQRLAHEMGYTPNAVAQSLKGQRSNTIGLVVTSIADPFYGRVVRGVDEVAKQAGIDVFLGVSYNNAEQELAVIESFHRRRVDGIISASSRLTETHAPQLKRVAVPIVVINRQADSAQDIFRAVEGDSYDGAFQAVTHLLGLGHTAIAFLGATNRPQSNRLRKQGYLAALQAAGITAQPGWVQESPPDRRSYSDDVTDGQTLMLAALRAGVTAAFCFNDMHAVGALLTCRELGLHVPSQMSIIGFDDVEVAQYVTPPLTTVHQPKLRLGQLAMEMLLNLMDERPIQNQRVPLELIVRCSTAPAPPMVFQVAPQTTLAGRLPCEPAPIRK
jgi:LacI family transcriptional regulator/LacI family repressor for deo operon, udp, cdd, tsx, nupC, and nupG